ncbi:MAG: aminopeptidase [Verrucomicrobia bacterium]|nr:aminopeptidase [Verrucomicrobiota bacterium]
MKSIDAALAQAARNVVEHCLSIRPGEVVSIVTDSADPGRIEIARAFWQEARAKEAEVILAEMLPRKNSGEEPPAPIAQLMAESNVVLCPTAKSLSHTQARRIASARGARIASLPTVTKEMVLRCLAADYASIAGLTKRVAAKLSGASKFKVESELGTRLELERQGRTVGADTGLLTQRGDFGNLPAGEAFFAPMEGTTNGKIVFDGSVADLGILREPIELQVECGVARIVSTSEAARELDRYLSAHGPEAYNIAELGVGTNNLAIVSGCILEDEKALGTVHIALGNNAGMGGTVNVPIHLDGLIRNATLYVDGELLLDKGTLVISSEPDSRPSPEARA